jgi:RimJ/RimL family protein N-acetyltransferase
MERYEKLEDFTMGIFSRDGAQLLGGTGLHPRGRKVCWEIGYWVRADAEGRGYVTEASIALTQVALGLAGLPRLEIRCDSRNLRSRRIPERLGFKLEGVLRHALRDVQGKLCDTEVWALLETEYAAWSHQGQEIQCFDRAGTAIPWPGPALHP